MLNGLETTQQSNVTLTRGATTMTLQPVFKSSSAQSALCFGNKKSTSICHVLLCVLFMHFQLLENTES